jgi:hypothetical protein
MVLNMTAINQHLIPFLNMSIAIAVQCVDTISWQLLVGNTVACCIATAAAAAQTCRHD